MREKFSRCMFLGVLAGAVLGFAALFLVHFFQVEDEQTHYHANFALYVNGEQEDFDSFTFYEEVQACAPGEKVQPESRVHMHDMENHIVHVHDEGVTWGHFFANLGYGLDNDALITDDEVFVSGEDAELSFILNGDPVSVISNDLIGDEDTLLINYGNEDDATMRERYDDIPQEADEYNQKDDPSTCAGNQELTFLERVQQALGL